MPEAPKIGSIVSAVRDCLELVGLRDAFHVPSVLVHSEQQLLAPGEWVRFVDHKCTQVVSADQENDAEMHAIVDPFLMASPVPGQLFWVFIKPSLVDKFSHRYDIKGFPTLDELVEEEKEAAYQEYGDCRGCN